MAAKLPFDVSALLKIVRISDPQISPNGNEVAFVAQSIDFEQNTKSSQIWVVYTSGGTPRQITHEGTTNERPRWLPDSEQLAFVSNRGGTSQIWMMKADGGEARQITNLSTEAGGVTVSADGKRLLFTSSVYPDCADDNCAKARIEAAKNNKVQARSYTELLYRHWTDWQGARRSHLFTIGTDGSGLKDLTPGSRDVPPFSLGGMDGYAFSPEGTEVCYVMKPDPDPSTSTNSELFTVPLSGGEAKKVTSSPGADVAPSYSPDGKLLAFLSQERAGYESDRWRLMVMDRATGVTSEVVQNLDRPVAEFTWSPDGSRLFFTTEDRGRKAIRIVPAAGGASSVIASGHGSIGDIRLSADGKTMVYSEQSGSKPLEIYRIASTGGAPAPLTHLNDALLSQYELTPLEEFWVDAPDQAKIHSFLIKPPGFQGGKKYPVLFLIHGGPEGAWGEDWSYRWNAQVFAGAGYVVVMPNPRGSTGYGQKFTEEIQSDWGGRAYDDIMTVADHVSQFPYADPQRMAAAGGSYGGYMVDWILGHTDRFKALVSHAGVFDLRSMAGATEELWFPIWEFGGMPWDQPEVYAKWSPSYYVKDFKTPTLVVTGELDFRVPYTQSLQLFTALKLRNVPAKLLVYPDEGHWVLKPQNSSLWYNTVLDWLGEWLKNPAPAPAKAPEKN
ncbi:MAG TPA: S9 family peptidase [Bryobacteraceae bacterium]|jgi:dipeptidyl aminopeptidase/acylaminoacyl peptidase|nr:S9 family peptidase [Bryobacteraceae bacterium]